ncbi:MAG: hypothetical protein WBA57_18495 [Elainellaceae cyanobacterium]
MTHMSSDPPHIPEEKDHAAFDAKLQALEPTSRRTAQTFSLKNYVRQHYGGLNVAHQKGHTWSALAELIKAELEISIAPETLRKYMAAIRREHEKKQAIKANRGDGVEAPSYQPHLKSSSLKRQDMPLSKNLQPSMEHEFRRSHRRPKDG